MQRVSASNPGKVARNREHYTRVQKQSGSTIFEGIQIDSVRIRRHGLLLPPGHVASFGTAAGGHEPLRCPSLAIQCSHCIGTVTSFPCYIARLVWLVSLLASCEGLRSYKVDIRAGKLSVFLPKSGRGYSSLLVLSLNASLDPKHLFECVFVSMLNFEGLPLQPESGRRPWITEL